MESQYYDLRGKSYVLKTLYAELQYPQNFFSVLQMLSDDWYLLPTVNNLNFFSVLAASIGGETDRKDIQPIRNLSYLLFKKKFLFQNKSKKENEKKT